MRHLYFVLSHNIAIYSFGKVGEFSVWYYLKIYIKKLYNFRGFFEHQFHISAEQANQMSSIIYLISAFFNPIFGRTLDKTGGNLTWQLVSIVVTILAHLILTFTSLNPYIGISMIAFAYSAWSSSFWPSIGLIIPEHQLGTAYGM